MREESSEQFDVSTDSHIVMPNAALIFSGYSGAGKSTAMRAVEEVNPGGYRHSRARYTTRPRRPDETERDGHFVDDEKFEGMLNNGQFVFDYGRYGNHYGFDTAEIDEELNKFNPMLVGGKEDTARALKKSLERHLEDVGSIVVPPVILFVSRSRQRIIEGIMSRPAHEDEKRKRIADVEEHYSELPKILMANEVQIVDNNDDDPGQIASRIIEIVQKVRLDRVRDLFGSNATPRDSFEALKIAN